ncbi:hypothetical protein Ga0061063_1280 [Gulbenkiania indica]|uniref:Uncharacterized protein n=1 Tax=Gulbenkiania indica TaxID=375574 RepID=A0A0K6GV62_9NEIS|nr:hypothetical protein Ga0061063_1280 [Gulbenkiania indica]
MTSGRLWVPVGLPWEDCNVLREDRRLRRELIWVIVLKLVVLAVLWRVFIAPKRVRVDSQRMVEVMVVPDTSVRHSGEKDAR